MSYDFNKLPLAGNQVSGLTVMESVPNQDSIGSSIGKYLILSGIREVSMDFFTIHQKESPLL